METAACCRLPVFLCSFREEMKIAITTLYPHTRWFSVKRLQERTSANWWKSLANKKFIVLENYHVESIAQRTNPFRKVRKWNKFIKSCSFYCSYR